MRHQQRQQRAADYEALASAIRGALKVLGVQPQSAVDFGCSIGMLLGKLGIDDSLGLDNAAGLSEKTFVGYGEFRQCDLADYEAIQDALRGRKFDLIICQEVAEHIDTGDKAWSLLKRWPLVRGITDAAKDDSVLVFGAAYPGQPGDGHINCRHALEWVRLFDLLRFRLDPRATAVYNATIGKHMPTHYRQHTNCYLNTMIFRREAK